MMEFIGGIFKVVVNFLGAIILLLLMGLSIIYGIFPNMEVYYDNFLDPVQTEVLNVSTIEMEKNGQKYYIKPQAQYEITGILKSIKLYDVTSISPIDFAIAWGVVNAPETDKKINYYHTNRYINYIYHNPLPISNEYLISHISNNHLIPKDFGVLCKLLFVRKNDKVTLKGYLVNVSSSSFATDWNSSLTRYDAGNGGCEIFYVNEVTVNRK